MTKLAIGEIDAFQPLDGEMYGSAGATITLLAIGVAGGNAKTEYFVLSIRAAAMPARNVVIADGMANQSAHKAIGKELKAREREPAMC